MRSAALIYGALVVENPAGVLVLEEEVTHG